jgi:hypothetical protein
MAVELHYNEIAQAVRRLLRDGRPLLADTDGSNVVRVASDDITVGTAVEISDGAGQTETHTVVEVTSAGEVRLDGGIAGSFEVALGGILRPVRSGEPDLKWIGQGPVELMPEPRLAHLPCAVVTGGAIEQPLNGGTNRSYSQEYHYVISYVRRLEADEAADARVMDEAAVIFRRLMSDTYLGGTCWYSQIVRVDPQPECERTLRARGLPVRVVQMELVARRAEVG